MTYRSESEALRARADSLEQDLQRQKAEVAEGRAAKAKAKALEQELAAARAKLAKLEQQQKPKPRSSSPVMVMLVLGIVLLMGGGAVAFFLVSAPVREVSIAAPPVALPTPPIKSPEVVPPRPKIVEPASVATTGSLDKASIRRVIRRHLRQMRYCYERALREHPELGGKLVFEWTINLNGTVSEAKLKSSTMAASGAVDCMLRSIRRWRFPRPQNGPVKISYPFVFKSS